MPCIFLPVDSHKCVILYSRENYLSISDALSFQPEFAEPIVNISVAVGRDATFTCHVRHLGGYRVSKMLFLIIVFRKKWLYARFASGDLVMIVAAVDGIIVVGDLC